MAAVPSSSSLSSSSPSFSTHVHIRSDLVPNASRNLHKLREMVSSRKPSLYNKYKDTFLSDLELNRFLVAKSFVCKKGENAGAVEYNFEASSKLLCAALEWRDKKRLDFIESEEGWQQEMEREGCTGKIYIPGHDKYGRPVIIFDDGAQNTDDVNGQLRYLAWSLNLACRFMNPSEVDKYVVFINLEKFSIFSCPSMQTSKETINMLCNMFPERMGHCIAYKGPAYFTTFFNIVKPLIDPKTVSKINFVNGDVSDGSSNDAFLRGVIGDNWKQITGATGKVFSKGSSPGYNHNAYWPSLMERVKAVKAKEERGQNNRSFSDYERKDDGVDDNNDDSEFKYSLPRSNLTSSVSTPYANESGWNPSYQPNSPVSYVSTNMSLGPHTPDMPRPPDNRFRTRGVKINAGHSSNMNNYDDRSGANRSVDDAAHTRIEWTCMAASRKPAMIEIIWEFTPSLNVFIFVHILILTIIIAIMLAEEDEIWRYLG